MKKIILLLWITLHLPAWAEDCPQWDKKEATDNINRLSDEVAHHDERYFNQSAPIISDSEYDALAARLKHWQACFPALEIKTHFLQNPQSKYTVKHQARMGSLKKALSDEEVKRFLARISGSEVLVQPKIDGIAVELVYENGQLIQASTRGNGETGVDILNHIRQIPLIPKTLTHLDNQTIILHGELFARLDKVAPSIVKQYATARHMVAGQLNRSEPEIEAIKAFDFFPWHWINSPYSSDLKSIKTLSTMGFPLPLEYTHKVSSYRDVKQLLQHYSAIKKPLFLMDGIVIKTESNVLRNKLGWTDNTPGWAIALKFAPESAISEVEKIAFTIGRTGHITPILQVSPVMIKNRTITKVSLGSIQNLKKQNIALGDQVSILLKGSAIPVFGNVLFRPENRVLAKLPDTNRYTPFTCLSLSPGCEEQLIARLTWLIGKQGLDLTPLDKPTIQQLVSTGKVKALVDILQLDHQSLLKAGMTQSESQQYLQSITEPKSLRQQIRAIGIPGVGKTKAKQLAGCINDLGQLVLISRKQLEQCFQHSAQPAQNIKTYVDKSEVELLIEALKKNVPTRSVGTR